MGRAVKLLLDTCSFIWLTSESRKLSAVAARAIDAKSAQLYFSDASTWEVCLKWQTGKLGLPAPPRHWLTEQLDQWFVEVVPLEQEHFFRSTELPAHHRDPFDRLLVAQAIHLGMTVVTPDPAVLQYPVATLW